MSSHTKPYKGYRGSVEYSAEDGLLFGKIVGIRDLVNFEAAKAGDVEHAFQSAVDEYLADCEHAGTTPEKPFSGTLNIRIPSEVHEKLYLMACEGNTKLNTVIVELLSQQVGKKLRSSRRFGVKATSA